MAKAALWLPGITEVANRFNEIEELQAEVGGHLEAIQELYDRIARAAGIARGRPGRAGRRAGRAARRSGAGGRPRGRPVKKRAKRGALRDAIHKILAGGKVMGCSKVVAALPKVGYKSSSDPKVFYNTVYLALKNNKGIEKTKDGFKLKAGAAK